MAGAKKPAAKKGQLLKHQEFWLRPADLAAMAVAVIEVRRSGTAKSKVAAIFDAAGAKVVDCKFSNDVSQDIPLQQGQKYQLGFTVKGSKGDTWRFEVRSKTTGSTLTVVARTLKGTSDSGTAPFTAQ